MARRRITPPFYNQGRAQGQTTEEGQVITTRNTNDGGDATLIDIEDVRDQALGFWENNQKIITYVFGGIALAIAAWFAYNNFYIKPREEKAQKQIFQAQFQFERDSFAAALSNPGGGYSGFVDIAKKFSGTKAANLANYSAGICYLNLGKFDDAIKYLDAYSPKDDYTKATTYSALGDAYSEKGKFDDAISYYKKGISAVNADVITPYIIKKLGMLYEKQNKPKDALDCYTKIKENHSSSYEANDIDKYIERISSKVK
jgi:tetratricopeptide (TPR) repeat protein